MSKKESEEYQKVLTYLRNQNRPYSVQDITGNLNKEVGKTAVQRALELYVSEKKVREKVYSKTKVYCIDQSTMPRLSESELKELDAETENAIANVKSLKTECKSLEQELSRRKSSLSLEEARAKAEESRKTIDELRARVTELKSDSDGKQISAEEKSRIQEKHTSNVGHWRKRKRIALNMLDQILEEYPKSKRELLEEVGVETDEDHGVKIPETK